jgi:hypothetical protein
MMSVRLGQSSASRLGIGDDPLHVVQVEGSEHLADRLGRVAVVVIDDDPLHRHTRAGTIAGAPLMRPGVRCTSGQSDQSMSMRSSLTISRRSLIQAANSSLLSPPGNWPAISLPCVHDPLLFVGHVAVANLRADRFQELLGHILCSVRLHVLDNDQRDGDMGLLAHAEIYPCGTGWSAVAGTSPRPVTG